MDKRRLVGYKDLDTTQRLTLTFFSLYQISAPSDLVYTITCLSHRNLKANEF